MIVSWYPRKDGSTPKNTAYSNQDLFKYAPKFLVDFYESKLKFFKKEENNT